MPAILIGIGVALIVFMMWYVPQGLSNPVGRAPRTYYIVAGMCSILAYILIVVALNRWGV